MIVGIVAQVAAAGGGGGGLVNPTYSGLPQEGQLIDLIDPGSGWQGADVSGGYSVNYYLDGALKSPYDNGPFNTTFSVTTLRLDTHHAGMVLTAEIFSYDADDNETVGPVITIGTVAALAPFRMGWTRFNTATAIALSGTHNETVSASAGSDVTKRWVRANKGRTAGDWYFEVDASLPDFETAVVGVGDKAGAGVTDDPMPTMGKSGTSNQVGYLNSGGIHAGSNTATKTGPTWTSGQRVGVAVRIDPTTFAAKVWFTLDGTAWNNSTGTPATGTGHVLVNPLVATLYPLAQFRPADSSERGEANIYGNADEFLFTPPSGFAAWDGGAA